MQKPANLLWTSGWDSTFRLLDLLIVKQRVVQPYYIKDHKRRSLQMELETMEKLKKMIFNKAPYAKQLLLPTIFKDLQDIKPNEALSQQYKRLSDLKHLGAQYEWLAWFAEEAKINNLELCVNKETLRAGCFTKFIYPCLIQECDGNGYNFKVEDNPTNPDIKFFKYFRFPMYNQTKLDTQKLSIRNGFLDIMQHTWFCHSPKKEHPCGICNPCCMTIEDGLSDRLPMKSRVRNFVHYKVKLPVKQLLSSTRKTVEVSVT